jgi:Coenzyme PQQ synthesis protein D (PqqD)
MHADSLWGGLLGLPSFSGNRRGKSIVISLRRRLDGVSVQDLESEVVVLDREADKIHQLNQTATFIWRHVEETPSADKMAKLLAESFEVEEQVAVRDVLEALNQLRALNLVQEC